MCNFSPIHDTIYYFLFKVGDKIVLKFSYLFGPFRLHWKRTPLQCSLFRFQPSWYMLCSWKIVKTTFQWIVFLLLLYRGVQQFGIHFFKSLLLSKKSFFFKSTDISNIFSTGEILSKNHIINLNTFDVKALKKWRKKKDLCMSDGWYFMTYIYLLNDKAVIAYSCRCNSSNSQIFPIQQHWLHFWINDTNLILNVLTLCKIVCFMTKVNDDLFINFFFLFLEMLLEFCQVGVKFEHSE